MELVTQIEIEKVLAFHFALMHLGKAEYIFSYLN